jgi:hypothetical protein
MDQSKRFKKEVVQVPYMGRWVPKDQFRAYVYSESEQKLADSWDEFQRLIASGLWFESKEAVENAILANLNKEIAEKPQSEPEKVVKEEKAEKEIVKEPVKLNDFKSSKTKGK